MIKPHYRIVHIVDVPAPAVLEAQRLGFGWCTSRRCPEAPTYLLLKVFQRCCSATLEKRMRERHPTRASGIMEIGRAHV